MDRATELLVRFFDGAMVECDIFELGVTSQECPNVSTHAKVILYRLTADNPRNVVPHRKGSSLCIVS